MSLSNLDLIKISKHSNIPLDAVVNKDQLIEIPNEWSRRSFSLVINLMDLFDSDGYQLPGSHWVGLYYDPTKLNGGFVYFDSYGFQPPIEVINMANRINSQANFLWNSEMIQRLNSTICGYYTMYFLHAMNKAGSIKKKFQKFQDDFHDPIKNTKRLDQLLKKHFGSKSKT